jgi:hypothetical protein
MKSDWIATGFIAVIVGLLVWLFTFEKISRTVFLSSIIVILIADLWRVDFRVMDIPKKKLESEVFAKTDVVEFLKQDTSTFRIADLNAFPSPNVAAYFNLENIHGYHSAKMRVYQDLMDEAGNGGGSAIVNPLLWNLLNVKYILASQLAAEGLQPVFSSPSTGIKVFANPNMMQRAQFVNHVAIDTKSRILEHLKSQDFNPRDTAWVEEALPMQVDTAGVEAKATLIEKKNESLKFDVSATGNNLLFVSEIYYPVSWKAYIDGNETPIYKTNFAFRSVIVPKGKHTLEFRYSSPKYEQGKTLSLAANLLLLAAAIGATFLEWKKRRTVS